MTDKQRAANILLFIIYVVGVLWVLYLGKEAWRTILALAILLVGWGVATGLNMTHEKEETDVVEKS